jgi:hypothetical protein
MGRKRHLSQESLKVAQILVKSTELARVLHLLPQIDPSYCLELAGEFAADWNCIGCLAGDANNCFGLEVCRLETAGEWKDRD